MRLHLSLVWVMGRLFETEAVGSLSFSTYGLGRQVMLAHICSRTSSVSDRLDHSY